MLFCEHFTHGIFYTPTAELIRCEKFPRREGRPSNAFERRDQHAEAYCLEDLELTPVTSRGDQTLTAWFVSAETCTRQAPIRMLTYWFTLRNSCHTDQKYVRAICSAHALLQSSCRESQNLIRNHFIDFLGKIIVQQDENTHNWMISAFCLWVNLYGIRRLLVNMETTQAVRGTGI